MATAINDFIQGIIMLIGIVADDCRALVQGGFIEAVRKMAELPSDVPVTMGQPGHFTSFFRTRSSEPAWRGNPYFPGYLGTSSDDREILCH